MDNENRIIIPERIHSDYNGYEEILQLFYCYLSGKYNMIITDFKYNTWFDSNLLPIIYAYVIYGEKHRIKSSYENHSKSKLHDIIIRNGFGKWCFDTEYKPRKKESVVPFQIFNSNATYSFGEYIDAELLRYFPRMEQKTKKKLSVCIQELFGNAKMHGECDKVFTCGQYYYKNNKMDFTIVNLGRTIGENVVEYLIDFQQTLPENNIAWAVKQNNSTKRINSGGIGLSLMYDFICYNSGKYQIISGDEFWEIAGKVTTEKIFKGYFPGTIINIEFNQNNTSYYMYDEDICENIF